MIHYVIPARSGSKGFPGKNRRLFPEVYRSVKYEAPVTVVTDDEEIASYCDAGELYYRPMDDLSSMKDVLQDCAAFRKMAQSDIIVMLYCVYPQRRWRHVQEAVEFFNRHHGRSLLCRKEARTNPFLCMFDNGLHGSPVIQHRFYRRQDYLRVFEISHYIAVMSVDELPLLNRNLYNEDTIYFPIGDVVNIDTEEDYERYRALHLHD